MVGMREWIRCGCVESWEAMYAVMREIEDWAEAVLMRI
jgi:hypothetical protein